MELSFILKAVISLRLLPLASGKGRIPAVAIMLSTPTVRKLILEGRTTDLYETIEKGSLFGMQTFNQSILNLYQAGKIGYEEAMENSDNPELLELAIKGIFTGTDTFKAH